MRINQLQDKYSLLSREFGLPDSRDRMAVSGFRPVGGIRFPSSPDASKKFQSIGPVDLFSKEDHSFGFSKDLRHLFPTEVEARNYHRSGETKLTQFAKRHIVKDHPERVNWISNHNEMISLTAQAPDIVEKTPWKRNNGHWSQTFVKEFNESDGFVVVAISLANLPGETESDFHQVTSIFFTTKKSDFFGNDGKLKKRWISSK